MGERRGLSLAIACGEPLTAGAHLGVGRRSVRSGKLLRVRIREVRRYMVVSNEETKKKLNNRLTHGHGREGHVSRRLREASFGVPDNVAAWWSHGEPGQRSSQAGGRESRQHTVWSRQVCSLVALGSLHELVLDLHVGDDY